jgi:hypothetical protein
MVYFQTKNHNLDNFWRALKSKIQVYFMAIWNILRPFGIFYGLLVILCSFWYISSHFGILYHEKSGNPGLWLGTEFYTWVENFMLWYETSSLRENLRETDLCLPVMESSPINVFYVLSVERLSFQSHCRMLSLRCSSNPTHISS